MSIRISIDALLIVGLSNVGLANASRLTLCRQPMINKWGRHKSGTQLEFRLYEENVVSLYAVLLSLSTLFRFDSSVGYRDAVPAWRSVE